MIVDDPKLIAALHAADAAGDTAGATAIAAHIKAMRQYAQTAQGAPATAPVGGSPPSAAMLAPDGSSGLGDRVYAGLAGAGIHSYLGIKNLFGSLTPIEQKVLEASDEDVKNSGFAGKAANLAGNVGSAVAASAAVPESALAGTVALLGRAAPYVKAALGSGAMAGITEPAKNQDDIVGDKLAAARNAALTGAVGTGVVKGVASVGTGIFKATQDAIDLMKQGITPTLQQAADSKVGRWLGGLTSGFSDVRGRQEQELLDTMTTRASGGAMLPQATKTPLAERNDQIGSTIDDAYDAILGNKKFPMNNDIRNSVLQQADNIKKSGGRFLDQQSDARGILDNIIGSDTNATRMGNAALRGNYLDRIDTALQGNNDPLVSQALLNAKNILIQKSRNAPLSPDELSQLGSVDSRYYDLQRMRDAATGDSGMKTGINIGKLTRSYGNAAQDDVLGATNDTADDLIGPLVRTIGETPNQNESRSMFIAAKRIAAPMLAGAGALSLGAGAGPVAAVGVPLYGLSALGQTAGGARFLTGQQGWQQALKGALDSPQTDDVTFANLLRAARDNTSALGAVPGMSGGQ